MIKASPKRSEKLFLDKYPKSIRMKKNVEIHEIIFLRDVYSRPFCSVVDPDLDTDPVGSKIICRIRIRNY